MLDPASALINIHLAEDRLTGSLSTTKKADLQGKSAKQVI